MKFSQDKSNWKHPIKNNVHRERRNDDAQINFNQRIGARSEPSMSNNRISRDNGDEHAANPSRNTIAINNVSKCEAIETLDAGNDERLNLEI